MTAAVDGTTGRANQKARTRKAIVDACRELTRSGAEITMPDVARAAMVSEATAYRYFPDLVTLLQAALAGLWPAPADALARVAGSADPAERVGFACAYLIRGVHAYQGSVRAMISHTIAAPAQAQARPGIRFDLLDYALAPFAGPADPTDPTDPASPGSPAGPGFLPPAAMARLKQELAIVVSAEALFVLTDLCGLRVDDAVATAVHAAETLTRAAFAGQAAA
jgi:AcrR family transcriptional regulator